MNRLSSTGRTAARGFTLVELLLVIAILGILAATVAVNLVGQTDKARKRAALTDIKAIETALELYELDVGRFPTEAEGLSALVTDPGVDNWGGPYLKTKSIPKDPWGKEYVYDPNGERGMFYDLFSTGKDGTEETEDDIGNWDKELDQVTAKK